MHHIYVIYSIAALSFAQQRSSVYKKSNEHKQGDGEGFKKLQFAWLEMAVQADLKESRKILFKFKG